MSARPRFATFGASPGQGDELAERLLHTATLFAELPEREMRLIDRDLANPDTIRVSEICASERQSDRALSLPEIRESTG
jgi:hypothetical protein